MVNLEAAEAARASSWHYCCVKNCKYHKSDRLTRRRWTKLGNEIWICEKHYNRLAKLQHKPILEEIQKKRVSGTIKESDWITIP